MVLVVIDAFELGVDTVDINAARIDADGADTDAELLVVDDGSGACVGCRSCRIKRRAGTIQIGRFGRPQDWMRYRDGLGKRSGFVGTQRHGLDRGAAKQPAVAAVEIGGNVGCRGNSVVVSDGGFNGDRSRRGTNFGMYVKAVFGNVDVVVFIEPYMTIDTRPFVIPPFVLGGIHTNDEDIVVS